MADLKQLQSLICRPGVVAAPKIPNSEREKRVVWAAKQLPALHARGEEGDFEELHKQWNLMAEKFETEDLGFLLDEALEAAQGAERREQKFHFSAQFVYLAMEWCAEELDDDESETELPPRRLEAVFENAYQYLVLLTQVHQGQGA